MLCALASLVAQMPRKLCIFAQHVEFTCVIKGEEMQRRHVSASGTPVHTFVLLQRKAQQRILQAASLRAGRRLGVLLSLKMVRGDPLEGRSETIFKEGYSRKLIV